MGRLPILITKANLWRMRCGLVVVNVVVDVNSIRVRYFLVPLSVQTRSLATAGP